MEETSQPQPEKSYTSAYGKRPLWQWVVIYLVIGAIVYGLVYYFVFAKKGYNYNPTSQNQTPTETVTSVPSVTTTTASPSAANSTQVTVEGNEFAFTPSAFTVKKGEPVTLTFKNTGKYPHNLTISALNVSTKTIQPGQEDTITFTPDKAGSFTYICTVPGHADRGMKGTLTVE